MAQDNMATLYKHGEIGQIDRVSYKIAYCHDGQILRNQGDGWKQWKRLNPEFAADPVSAFNRAKDKYAQKLAENPCFSAWRSQFHELVSFKDRGIVLAAISSMPQDPDGVWSSLDDYSIELSIDECVSLCEAYEVAQMEARSKQQATEAA